MGVVVVVADRGVGLDKRDTAEGGAKAVGAGAGAGAAVVLEHLWAVAVAGALVVDTALRAGLLV